MIVTYSGFDELSKKFKVAPVLVESWKARTLRQAGIEVREGAKARAHVQSGRLRDSIESEVTADSVAIFTDLEYAIYQEFGTAKMPGGNPFMIPAFMAWLTKLPASFLFMVKKVFW